MNPYKKLFPIFEKLPELHYLDSAATALKPAPVLLKMVQYYSEYSANIHRGLYPISEQATAEYEAVREKTAKFIGANDPQEIIFTSGTTDGINKITGGWAEINLREGDEIVVTEAEHHSNFVPWQQLAKRKNLKLKIWPIKEDFQMAPLTEVISSTTKLLAISQVSNVLGQINPVKDIIGAARVLNPNICVVVDGAQAVPHIPVNVAEMDADFYVFSGHKLYGPTGVGVIYGKTKRWQETEPAAYGGGMIKEVGLTDSSWAQGPERFEAGTPPIAGVIGLGAAIDFMSNIGFEEIRKNEEDLTQYLLTEIKKIGWLGLIGPEQNRIGVVSLFARDTKVGTSHDIADILGRDFNVCVRAGHHCTMPLHEKLGIATGTVRVSLGMYNEAEDIDELIKGLNSVWMTFTKK